MIARARTRPSLPATDHLVADDGAGGFLGPQDEEVDRDAGEAKANFRLGFGPQTVELAGFRLVNYGRAMPMGSLPATLRTYDGRRSEAAWRREAARRIGSPARE